MQLHGLNYWTGVDAELNYLLSCGKGCNPANSSSDICGVFLNCNTNMSKSKSLIWQKAHFASTFCLMLPIHHQQQY